MPTKNIVFIDPHILDYQSIIDGLGEPAEVFILDGASDGLTQMAEYLKGRSGIDAIHVISHGSQGALYLGSTVLNSRNIDAYVLPLAIIGSALATTGDILVYGCNVAQGEAGVNFVQSLALYTRADVAASSDTTGEATMRGNLVLEVANGSIESTPLPVVFQGLLAAQAGVIVSDIGSPESGGSGTGISMLVQPDGKIVVGGTKTENNNSVFALARYSSYGSLDTTFDLDGKVTTSVGNSGSVGYSLAQQADGKILMAGRGGVARYDTDGSLDSSFDSDGKLISDSSVNYQYVAVQADQKILVAGIANMPWGIFELLRYNSDGSLDTGFDTDGKVTFEFSGGEIGEIQEIINQPDGKIIVGASVYFSLGNHYEIGMLRFNIDGSLDNSFGLDGMVTSDIGGGSGGYFRGFALQSDGKILVAGTSGMKLTLLRYNSNGSFDTSFDTDGLADVNFNSSGGQSLGYSVTTQSDGKIIIAGISVAHLGNEFALVRFNPDGSIDNTFGSGGKVVTSIGVNAWAYNVLLQTDGKILVSGLSSEKYAEFATLARYNTDGSLDVTFNGSLPPVNQTFNGTNANETFISGPGNDTINGGAGIDTVQFGANLSAYKLTRTGETFTVHANSAPDGTDTLSNIERIQFADKNIALDLTTDGSAGKSLQFIGMLAHSFVNTPTVVGNILSIFDQGKSMKEVCQLAIDVGLTRDLAGSNSNLDLAKLVFRNVVGSEASETAANELAGYIQGNGGTMTQADFLATVAQLDLNNQHIGLVGLQSTGVEYII